MAQLIFNKKSFTKLILACIFLTGFAGISADDNSEQEESNTRHKKIFAGLFVLSIVSAITYFVYKKSTGSSAESKKNKKIQTLYDNANSSLDESEKVKNEKKAKDKKESTTLLRSAEEKSKMVNARLKSFVDKNKKGR